MMVGMPVEWLQAQVPAAVHRTHSEALIILLVLLVSSTGSTARSSLFSARQILRLRLLLGKGRRLMAT